MEGPPTVRLSLAAVPAHRRDPPNLLEHGVDVRVVK
jgi:hypothetical protein